MPLKYTPSITYLRDVLAYKPDTGVISWRVSPARRVEVGGEAGSLGPQGYRRIRVGRRFPAHHIAWALFYGEWPLSRIDHANGDASDNRIVNLRLATHGQNRANSVSHCRHGVKGVWLERRRKLSKPWGAQIWRDGALRNLGMFVTKAEAAAAVAVAHRA